MKNVFILFICGLFACTPLFSQYLKPKIDIEKSQNHVVSSASIGSDLAPEKESARLKKRPDLMLRFIPAPKPISHKVPDPELYTLEKEMANQVKSEALSAKNRSENQVLEQNERPEAAVGALELTVSLGKNFRANLHGGYTPPDNSLAISRTGYIVSAINSGLRVYTTAGTLVMNQSFSDFFGKLTNPPTGSLYDPKVIYDPIEERFILVVLHGNTPSLSEIMVCFSKTSSPRSSSDWTIYRLKGDPANRNRWFDYPNIAVSDEELFITGNLFDSNDKFQDVLVYQIDKMDGFAGKSMNRLYYQGIKNPAGADCGPFTLVPVSYGQDGSYGPGIYLVSTCSSSSDQVYLYDISNNIDNSPKIYSYAISTGNYSIAGDAYQKGSDLKLDNGGTRIRNGFYLNGVIHFVFSTDYDDTGYSRIRYNRLDVATKSIKYTDYGREDYDYSYPAIASLGKNEDDPAVVIGFLRSAEDIYPQARAFVFGQTLSDYSNSIVVKNGDTYVNISDEDASVERWGDYTGISRDFSTTSPAAWYAGAYGTYQSSSNPHVYNTWIGRLTYTATTTSNAVLATKVSDNQLALEKEAKLAVAPNPISDLFNVSIEQENPAEIEVVLLDLNGRLVRTLYTGKANKGNNTLTFNKMALTNGVYVLSVKDLTHKAVRHERLVVQY